MIEIDDNIKANFVKEYIAGNDKQILAIAANDDLKIIITIPHNVFEWYVDVFDKNGAKVYTNWLDHFGDNESNLRTEMKESVQGFMLAVTKYPLRLIVDGKPEQSILQVYRDDMWVDMIY
jgi:hypothetical protein